MGNSYIEKHYHDPNNINDLNGCSNCSDCNDCNDYNEEPVLYCKQCLSLKIKSMEIPSIEDLIETMDYCDECGSTDIGECKIEEWEALYTERYEHSYLNREKRKRSIYFQ